MRNLFTPRTMDVLRIMLYEQPALSPLVGISLNVLLNTPYKWIICSDICCTSIMLMSQLYLKKTPQCCLKMFL